MNAPVATKRPTWLGRLTVAAALGLVLIALPLYAIKVDRKHDYTDFEVYYRAATRVHAGQWEQVYNLGDGASPFRYAPPLLPLFSPFAHLTLPQARLSWYFLQVLWFGLGFWFLERALRLTRQGHGRARRGVAPRATFVASFALLFILRFCLDCFTIGQVSSLLFLGYCAGLWAWMSRRPGWAGTALLVPSVFKIGPGILFSLFAATPKRRERIAALGAPLLWLVGATAFLRLWCGSGARFAALWRGWVEIVANDSVYYDASHYGSQSVKSALLRAVNSGWITADQCQLLYLGLLVAGCSAVLGFWAMRRARSPLGRGAMYALGVFPYLWFMPETFKYALTTLAVPVALLMAQPRKSRLTRIALVFGVATLSLPGLDVVGSRVFFALQRASVPLVATFLLGWATLRMAIEQTLPLRREEENTIAPWDSLPRLEPKQALSVLIPLPMQSVSTLNASWVRQLLESTESYLKHSGEDYEILLVPYGNHAGPEHPAWRQAALHATSARVSITGIAPPGGRGAALREGFLACSGRFVLAVNAEQACEPEFFGRALALLRQGQAQVVRGNRRLAQSRFRIPVRNLSLVYGRHRMGLMFNRLVRAWLPLHTTDTHSGTWAMTRPAALAIFALEKSPGFLFDLEAWITAGAHGYAQLDLPVTLFLAQEKSAKRIGLEAHAILWGLPALAWRLRAGCYARPASPGTPQGITADDWGLSPGVNQGILELARLGIVKRVSLMADGKYLAEGLAELARLPGLSLGLHFDLTYDKSTPTRVLAAWLDPRSDRARLEREAAAEFERQLGVLRSHGVNPTHLDGHHHIHLVPGVLTALGPLIRQAGIRDVRLPEERALLWSKPLLWCLARWARRSFRRQGFETRGFFYPTRRHFRDQGRLRARLVRDLDAEVIVHPALVDDLARLGVPDPYTAGRVTEYQALRMLAYGWDADSAPRSVPS